MINSSCLNTPLRLISSEGGAGQHPRGQSARLVMSMALLTTLAGCAGLAPPQTAPRDPSGTSYRPGDYVVYRYTGAFTPRPVTLSEQVIKQQGSRLEIYVLAERGDERLEWVQVVTDTPDNQKNNMLDELYLLEHGQRVRLQNRNNEDALRLFRWTMIMPEGRPRDRELEPCEKYFGGRTFVCFCETGDNTWRGEEIAFEATRCPGFLWTHGPARMWFTDSEQIVYKMEVKEFGRKPLSGE